MDTLAFDGRTGASGDMILGALLAAGADRDALAPVEDALGVEYVVDRVTKHGIEATSVDVVYAADRDGGPDDDSRGRSHGESEHGDEGHSHDGDDHSHDHGDDEDGDRSHGHSHDDGHSHGPTHAHDDRDHAEGRGPTRTYAEVRALVRDFPIPDHVVADALAVFEILGEAEAAVHGTDLEETHFHEVGADDAVADVVGACLLIDDLGVERVVTTPVAAGGGEVETSHGTYPVPVPAVVEIADVADWDLQGGPVDVELLTPTGAAVLAHVADGVPSLPSLRVDGSGYGAGRRDLGDRPNVLRAVVGEREGDLVRDEITVLETNLDDATPEVLGDLQRSLKDAGARDVSVIPATMKKSRPGHLVKVICKPEDARRVARRLARETGTLGVREHGAGHRWVARRAVETVTVDVEGESYDVDVKVATDDDGTVIDVSGEYEDAAAVADRTGLPVRAVLRRAEDAAR